MKQEKPNWDDAPEWAKWLCMDQDWEWNWCEELPEWGSWYWDLGIGKHAVASPRKYGDQALWDVAVNSLEKRP